MSAAHQRLRNSQTLRLYTNEMTRSFKRDGRLQRSAVQDLGEVPHCLHPIRRYLLRRTRCGLRRRLDWPSRHHHRWMRTLFSWCHSPSRLHYRFSARPRSLDCWLWYRLRIRHHHPVYVRGRS